MQFDRRPTELPTESPASRKQRAELLAAELALRDQVERVPCVGSD